MQTERQKTAAVYDGGNWAAAMARPVRLSAQEGIAVRPGGGHGEKRCARAD